MGVSTLKTGLATDWRQPLWFRQPVKDTGHSQENIQSSPGSEPQTRHLAVHTNHHQTSPWVSAVMSSGEVQGWLVSTVATSASVQ